MARKSGSHRKRSPVKTARQRVWNAMRVYKTFTALKLEIGAEVGPDNLKRYLKALHRAGYLRQDRPKQNGKNGGYIKWRLVGYTGPLAPIVRQDQSGLYDPNLDQFVPFQVSVKQESTYERLSSALSDHHNLSEPSEEEPTYGCAQRNLA